MLMLLAMRFSSIMVFCWCLVAICWATTNAGVEHEPLTRNEFQQQLVELKSELKRDMKREFEEQIQLRDVKIEALEHQAKQLQTKDIGRPPANCIVGTNYRFHEFPSTYALGMPYAIGSGMNLYRCLDECRRDSECLAVSISHDELHQCQGYRQEPLQLQNSTEWDYYRLEYTDHCWVDMPIIEFMVTLQTSQCFAKDELVVWDVVVYDSGDGLKADGKYHCPITGVYKFTMTALPNSCSGETAFDVMKNEITLLGRLYFETTSCSDNPGSVDMYTVCEADDVISVYANYIDSCVHSGPSSIFTSLSGRIVSIS